MASPFNGQVGAGADDQRRGTDFWDNSSTVVRVGNSGTHRDGSYRFTSVSVPKGATITAAYITVFCYSSANDGVGVKTNIYLEAADNPTAPTSKGDFEGRSLGTGVPWDDADLVNWNWNNSPSLVAAIQAVIDRAGWASGQAMQIFHKDDESDADKHFRIACYENEELGSQGDMAVKLHIEYTVPAGRSFGFIIG